jgi:periplasmic protein TonB
MNCFSKGVCSSLWVHAVAGIAVFSLSAYVPVKQIIQIDFNIENSSGISKKDPEPAPKLKKQEMTRPIQKEEVVHSPIKNEEKVVQTSAVTNSASENQAPVAAPVLPQEKNSSLSPVKEVINARAEPASDGNSVESAKQKYLKEHFTYIRDLIQKKLTYPRIARQMGWTGKVVISFIINTDGNVRDITVTEGSGFDILDKNTIEIVKKSSPFPMPPVEAQLLIPVKYNLN